MPSIPRRATTLAGVFFLSAALGGGSLASAGGQATATPSGTVTVTPFRILDTRNGTGGAVGPVGGGQTITLQISGVGPVPANATGVVLNITATEGTAPSFVTTWPTGEVQPNASILNVNPGLNLPNMITVALGAGGRIDLFNFAGSVHLVADVGGYLAPDPPAPPPAPTAHTLELVAYGAAESDATTFGHGCVTLPDSAPFGRASLSLPLPSGADITAVRARYRDLSAAGNVSIELHQVTGFAGGASASDGVVGGVFTSSGETLGNVGELDVPNDLALVSDSTLYYLRANSTPHAGALQFCGASVDYTQA